VTSVTHFKQWAIPGPRVPGGIDPEEGESLDALSGHFRIFQLKKGHRYSTDDLLVAWYGTQNCPSASRVLDLGSGIGSVGMVAAWRLPGARFVTVEAQDVSVGMARKSARFNGLIGGGDERYEIRHGDLRDPKILSESEAFDLILSSPPYFPLDTGVHGDHPQKIACRFEVRGTIADYCSIAGRHLALGGVFATVFPTLQEDRVCLAAREAGMTIVRSREVVLKEGEPPLLSLYLMMLSEHLPEEFRMENPGCPWPWKEPPLTIRTHEGKIHPEYSAVKMSIGFPP
jgi:tRNA1(Val) A37 N6-methylase TrmN6